MKWADPQIRALGLILQPLKQQQPAKKPTYKTVCEAWQAQFGSGRPADSTEKDVPMPSRPVTDKKIAEWWGAN